MNTRNIITPLLTGSLAIGGFVSCEHDTLELYSGPKASLFIQEIGNRIVYGEIISYRNDYEYSFALQNDDVMSTNVPFEVRLSGDVADVDRKYTLVVDTDMTDAVEGQDYNLSLNDFTIKAGCASDTVYVTLLRNPSLMMKNVNLVLRLKADNNFDVCMDALRISPQWAATTAEKLDATAFYLKFGEEYVEPGYWSIFGGTYWGAFSINKFKLLNELMGWTPGEWTSVGSPESGVKLGRFNYAAQVLQKYLQDHANAGTPVLDDDGSYMQLPSPYTVDYSAYM